MTETTPLAPSTAEAAVATERTWQLGRAAMVDVATAALAVGSAVLLLRFRLDSTWLIVVGAGLGTILGIVRAH